jgi:hypothetical protein
MRAVHDQQVALERGSHKNRSEPSIQSTSMIAWRPCRRRPLGACDLAAPVTDSDRSVTHQAETTKESFSRCLPAGLLHVVDSSRPLSSAKAPTRRDRHEGGRRHAAVTSGRQRGKQTCRTLADAEAACATVGGTMKRCEQRRA